ncbi:MAG: hypothetical protein LBQ66_09550 [Planctomycetaceae bacterium]|nr:hypothetical protein [Planctomycetaceae bacterium]
MSRRLLVVFIVFVFWAGQFGCRGTWSNGAWNDGVSNWWKLQPADQTAITTAPEAATFATQGLFLGQQGSYISPPSNTPLATPAPAQISATPIPASVITPNPATVPTPIATSNQTPTPIPIAPVDNSYTAQKSTNPNTVPASPTITNLPATYPAANSNSPSIFSLPNTSNTPQAESAVPEQPFGSNVNLGSIGKNESMFSPTEPKENDLTKNANIAPLQNAPNQDPNTGFFNNVPPTAYDIPASGTAETAFQSMETRAGTQVSKLQNGTTQVTTTTPLPVTSSSHIVTEINPE